MRNAECGMRIYESVQPRTRNPDRKFYQSAIRNPHSAFRISHPLYLKLHAPHAAPGQRVKDQTDDADDQDIEPHGRPPAALQQRVAHDLDVVLSPDEVREPA